MEVLVQMNYPVIERPIEAGPLERPAPTPGYVMGMGGGGGGYDLRPSDIISRLTAPTGINPGNPSFSPSSFLFPGLGGMMGMGIGGIISQLISALQAMLGGGNSANGNAFPYGDNEQFFQNATGGSVGDPHLSFGGHTWDNMGSQADLLHSDSFPGGYQLSTQTTPPQANGVTYNQSATLTTQYGGTQVTLDKDGNATIAENGQTYSLGTGETVDLGNGQLVARNQDGSLQITCDNGNGGEITTTMRCNGRGVDVNATANNVDLGGTLAQGSAQYGSGSVIPLSERYASAP